MKRLLSLDGGGIRGIFSIAVLERFEEILRERYQHKKPGFVLADYFDFIGGTSTGAIIAALLSKGQSIRAIREAYEQLGPIVFRKKPFWRSWRSFYGSEAFADVLKDLFQEVDGSPMTLGSERLGTLLMLVMRNGSTGSTWPITNHPEAIYNRRGPNGVPTNLDLPLWQLIRASAAAPAYFPVEQVELHSTDGELKRFEFVDGGISPYNSPALAMYLAATLPEYAINFSKGVDNLQLWSIGTGRLPSKRKSGELARDNLIGGTIHSLSGLIESVEREQDKLCRVLGHCIHGDRIDSEIGSLLESGYGHFLYCRYTHRFTDQDIAECRSKYGSKRPFSLDDLSSIPALLEIGRRYAAEHVHPEHFPE